MPRRRLIVRPGGIGDVILSLPALECLRADYTEIWVPRRSVPLIHGADAVDAIEATGLDLLELGLAPQQLTDRLGGFDEILSWYGASRAEFRSCLPQARFFDALPPAGAAVHAADFFLAQARTICGCPGAAIPKIPLERWNGGFAVIHPFSGSPKKNWPLERFRALAARLSQHLPVIWCAGPEERLESAQRFESLGDLAAWLAGASLFIGNDSGITHLAAAVGTPVVAVFQASDPQVWAPRGSAPIRIAAGEDESIVTQAALELLS